MPSELVTAAEIARRLGVTRQRIDQLHQAGDLPGAVHYTHPRGRSAVYEWDAIARWCRDTAYRVDQLDAWEQAAGSRKG